MSTITPPKYAKDVLRELETAGYKAFLVGGCVRDMFLERRPQDWDICTNALPEEVMSVFPQSEPTGLRHGTVTVLSRRHRVEVTTFRADGAYKDHRRPETVQFIADLNGDLERRDFTMNAIALPLSGLVIDPFDGRLDIRDRQIRCVGEPRRRFEEDALRMLRALRFSAKLDFEIEAKTAEAIYQCAPLAGELAPERVRDELEKILVSGRPGIVSRVMSFGLLDRYLLRKRAAIDTRRLATLPRGRQARWAGLCAALENSRLIHSTALFLRELRLDGSMIKNCAAGVRIAMHAMPADKVAWKRLLADQGVDVAACAAAASDMIRPAGATRALNRVLKSGECFSMHRLAVTGDDLLALGMKGVELGSTLRELLSHVIDYPADNEHDRLLSLAMEISSRNVLQCTTIGHCGK